MTTGYKQRVFTAIDKFYQRKDQAMNINDVFPSNFLKASDLGGKKLKLTIESVDMEEIGTERKPVMHFAGKQKGLVLNKSKASILSAAFGFETSQWDGQQVAIYPTKVAYQGQMVDAIGIEAVAPEADAGAADF
jgi:hypothetical protein